MRPDSPELAEVAGGWASAYLHIPFCGRVCPYCDFAVVAGRDGLIDRYLDALLAEIERESPWRQLDAIYVGGGTPSRMPAWRLARLISALANRFGLARGAEVSLEANPEDWTSALGEKLVEAGFNRLSLGAQSFDANVLESLGRRHSPERIGQAVRDARAAGLDSINLDLIYGAPTEPIDSWEATLRRAVELGPDHISTYALTVERGTALGRAVAAGAAAPDPDDQADKWELAAQRLATAGYLRYEVSNHARPGHHCRYNLSVWGQGEYLAFGLGAHRHRDGVRSRNVRSLDAYLARVEAEQSPEQGSERSGPWETEQERLLVGLRRTAGVITGPGGAALFDSPNGRRLVAAGVLAREGGRLRVLRPLLTDEVSRAVLALDPPVSPMKAGIWPWSGAKGRGRRGNSVLSLSPVDC